MQAVNNCLMLNNSNANDIALDKIKSVLIMFEKKKRNLDKRKTKLEDYKRKSDLNEDQLLAVSKFPEVVSNLELLEEFTNQTSCQYKEAEKIVKKIKKQEKVEKKRSEIHLIEFTLRTYTILDRLCRNERVQAKLVSDHILELSEVEIINKLFKEVQDENSDWKKLAEFIQSIYEGGDKKIEISSNEREANEKNISNLSKGELLSMLNKLNLKAEWLLSNCWQEFLNTEPVINLQEESDFAEEEEEEDDEEIEQLQQQTCVQELSENGTGDDMNIKPDESVTVKQNELHKTKNFVFLHESLVEKQEKDGFGLVRKHDEDNLQQMVPKINNSNNNTAWDTVEEDYNDSNLGGGLSSNAVDDVFSSATQSEFMQHSEHHIHGKMMSSRGGGNTTAIVTGMNSGNTMAGVMNNNRNNWQSQPNPRYRGGGGNHNGNNYWKSTGGPSNGGGNRVYSRYPRSNTRGGGPSRGVSNSRGSGMANSRPTGGRIDNRYTHSNAEPLSAQ